MIDLRLRASVAPGCCGEAPVALWFVSEISLSGVHEVSLLSGKKARCIAKDNADDVCLSSCDFRNCRIISSLVARNRRAVSFVVNPQRRSISSLAATNRVGAPQVNCPVIAADGGDRPCGLSGLVDWRRKIGGNDRCSITARTVCPRDRRNKAIAPSCECHDEPRAISSVA
jgi:hypothetical protein